VKIHDKAEEFVIMLKLDHSLHHGKIVAYVKRSRRLYSRKYSRHCPPRSNGCSQKLSFLFPPSCASIEKTSFFHFENNEKAGFYDRPNIFNSFQIPASALSSMKKITTTAKNKFHFPVPAPTL